MKIEIDAKKVKEKLLSPFMKTRYEVKGGKKVVVKNFSTWRFLTKVMATILAISGLTFGIFFVEEGDQKITFGNFPLADIGRVDILEQNLQDMRAVQKTGLFLNHLLGWANPFCFVGYNIYFGKATNAYLRSMEAVIAYKKQNTLPAVETQSSKQPTQDIGATPSLNVSQYLDPPEVAGAIDITKAGKWVGWNKVVMVPVTAVDKREKVAILKTPTPFSVVIFPSSPLYEKATSFWNKWLAVQGEIKTYKGSPEMVLYGESQILKEAPLTKGGGDDVASAH